MGWICLFKDAVAKWQSKVGNLVQQAALCEHNCEQHIIACVTQSVHTVRNYKHSAHVQC